MNRSYSRGLLLITALLTLMHLMGIARPAMAVWDGTETILLGDTVSAEFEEGGSTVPHKFEFYGPAGTRLDATLEVAAGASLQPMLELYNSATGMVDLGDALSGLQIKNFTLPENGDYYLQVTPLGGHGAYTLSTKGKYPKKIKDTTGENSYEFGAVGGTRLKKAQVKASKGSHADPKITGLTGPEGAIPIGKTSKIKNIVLPSSGLYRLEWANNGAPGNVDVKIKLKPVKSKEKIDLGIVVVEFDIPYYDLWLASGHADRTAEAFNHWNEDGEIPTSCARCHSTPGFLDFLGADGTDPWVVDNPAPVGTVIECTACHNDKALALDMVIFPSGEMVTGLGPEARCMQCHQGRESTVSVNEDIQAASGPEAPPDDDTVSPDLGFVNVHYFAAAATLYGNAAKGAYQYDGKIYDSKFPHVEAYDTCTACHNPHSLEVRIEECANCHVGVTDKEDLRDVRMAGSVFDYNANGDAMEGIGREIEGFQARLLAAIQDYARRVIGTPIVYDPNAYPYWFVDTNGNGVADPEEVNSGNRYPSWTARLVKATYNYHYSIKDPGQFAHNGKYMIEILYDSLADLNMAVPVPDMAKMVRNDVVHFDATAEAYRHWDADGEVSTGCARCHSPDGFDFYVEYYIDPIEPAPLSDGLKCETCHVVGADFGSGDPQRKYVEQVTFPSGVTIDNDPDDPDDTFICMTCHQGRESKRSVDEAIAAGQFNFKNIHYLSAGASLYGADAEVGYQYDGKTYVGKWGHYSPKAAQCVFCHANDHTFRPKFREYCGACHVEADGELENIRLFRNTDYDGDGNIAEPLKDEVATFGERLLAAMQAYAINNGLNPIVYDPNTHPYFFNDLNGNGVADPDEVNRANQYATWDPALMKAAFNYQMWQKEPGAWAHNTFYILELLYDSIEDLGGVLAVAGLTRPPVPPVP